MVPPGTSLGLEVPVSPLEVFCVLPIAVSVGLDGCDTLSHAGVVSYCPCPDGTVTIDGDLEDWGDVAAVSLREKGVVSGQKGDADLDGRLRICWDHASVYAAAEIRDDAVDHDISFGDIDVGGDGLGLVLYPSDGNRDHAYHYAVLKQEEDRWGAFRWRTPYGVPLGLAEKVKGAVARKGNTTVESECLQRTSRW